MIGECLAEDKEFGIVYYNATDIQTAGCTAGILKVIKRYDDGRLDILTHGQRRFLIKEIHDNKAYLEARITYFDDDEQSDNSGCQDLADRGIALLKQFTSFLESQAEYDFTKESARFVEPRPPWIIRKCRGRSLCLMGRLYLMPVP